jgi:DNA-binding response OmpR family regulator
VLVVNDDQMVRDLLPQFLRREGFEPHTAADGIEGLRKARTLQPEAIVLDVMMPWLDGWSVLAALKKATPSWPRFPSSCSRWSTTRPEGILSGPQSI